HPQRETLRCYPRRMATRPSRKRSIVKALTYRVFTICLDFVVIYLLTERAAMMKQVKEPSVPITANLRSIANNRYRHQRTSQQQRDPLTQTTSLAGSATRAAKSAAPVSVTTLRKCIASTLATGLRVTITTSRQEGVVSNCAPQRRLLGHVFRVELALANITH